jgi:hypothetical protein
VILGGDSTLFGLGLGAAAEWAFSRSGLLRFELPVVKVKDVDGVSVLPTVALAFAL